MKFSSLFFYLLTKKQRMENGKQVVDGNLEGIKKSLEGSLKRLKTDYIDLYQTHYPDPTTPLEETLSAYDQLIKEGKIKWIGASNLTAEQLKESLAVSAENGLPQYQTLQPHYNLYVREKFESGLEPVCLGNDLGVITYYSLESGFLSGKYRTEADLHKSARGGGMAKYFDERGLRILEALDLIADQTNSTPAMVALAWLIHRPSVTAPIVSATTMQQLNSLIKAPELELDANAIRLLTANSAW